MHHASTRMGLAPTGLETQCKKNRRIFHPQPAIHVRPCNLVWPDPGAALRSRFLMMPRVGQDADNEWARRATRLHWFSMEHGAWLSSRSDAAESAWSGWSSADASPQRLPASDWLPWSAECDASELPYVRWFCDALTNAAFNELDRHVLGGIDGPAFLSETADHPPTSHSLREMLLQSTLAASALQDEFEIDSTSRLAMYMPNHPLAVVWIEAAKRLGVAYVAIAAGTVAPRLADRLLDTAASVLVSSTSMLAIVRPALDAIPESSLRPASILVRLHEGDSDASGHEMHRDAATLIRRAHKRLRQPPWEGDAWSDAEAHSVHVGALWRLVAPRPVEASHPLFILYTSGSTGRPKGIVHAHGGYQVGLQATSELVLGLTPPAKGATSGANEGATQSARARPSLLVIATPGWITGQSYMIAAALLCASPSILLDGSPVSPPDRFAEVLARHRVSILKAGSTFLRMVMTSGAAPLLACHDLSALKLGTFCAEPVNESVHRFAATHLTPNYINSYWATEHGGIVWSRCLESATQPLRPDTRCWPLPWIVGDVLIRPVREDGASDEGDEGGSESVSAARRGEGGEGRGWRRAEDGEAGEVVIRRRYPYLALTVWASGGYGAASWRGDLDRWREYFADLAAGDVYVQGDTAVRDVEGAFTFHGRSDEVINVGGNRIGTAEIESALLRDSELPDSSVANCAVVGMPDALLGASPCAFIVPTTSRAALSAEDEGRLCACVKQHVGVTPSLFVAVPALPETYSGKYMRALLRALIVQAPLPSLGALRNPECLEPLRHAIQAALAGTNTEPRSAMAAAVLPHPLPQPGESGGQRRPTLDLVIQLARKHSGSDIGPSTPLMDGGLDSITSTHFVGSLQAHTSLPISPTLIFEHSTPEAIASHLAELVTGDDNIDGHRRQQQLHASNGLHHQAVSTTSRVGSHIFGVEGRWPHGAASTTELAHLAGAAANASGLVPEGRWSAFTAEDLAGASRTAQFLASVTAIELFDHEHFKLSAAEARVMDPQQRGLLEVSWRGLAHAGLSGAALAGSDTAVVLAISNMDWNCLQFEQIGQRLTGGSESSASVYAATGGALSVAAGRIAFLLDLHGPCESIDTACSSATVALHLSSLHLRGHDSHQALNAVATLVLSPHVSLTYARAGMLSVDGRCKTFDARANGYVRGEGFGVLLLGANERSSTCSTGTICGQMRSSTVRHDGMSASLTAPNGSAQIQLLKLALGQAAELDELLVESHGTGTSLGDPTEIRALARVLGRAMVTGIKSSVGHLEPAAGMVGAHTLVRAIKSARGAPNAQLRMLNPRVASSLEGMNLQLPTTAAALPASLPDGAAELPALGVSSFGYSGTIAHAIVSADATPRRTSAKAASMPARLCFRRRPFAWFTQRAPSSEVAIGESRAIAFLGVVSSQSESELVWEQHFSAVELDFLRNHRVGTVPLLPGTCYIEIARAVVRARHAHAGAFDLSAVAFSSILFLDEIGSNPTVRVAIEPRTGSIAITSRRETSAWDLHSTMELQLGRVADQHLPLAATQARVGEDRVTAEEYYAGTGNDYRGEFRSMQTASTRGAGAEVLSKVEYDHAAAERVHLRSCAWLDACLHAPIWWTDHRGRPFYIAAVVSYGIRSMNDKLNRVMWSVCTSTTGIGLKCGLDAANAEPANAATGFETLRYFSSDLQCAVQIDGSKVGFFDAGWLERRRTFRHLYVVAWGSPAVEAATNPSHAKPSPLLVLDTTDHQRALDFVRAFSSLAHACTVLRATSSAAERHLDQLNVLLAALTLVQSCALASSPFRLVLLTSVDYGLPTRDRSVRRSPAGLLALARTARQELPSSGLHMHCVQSSRAEPSLRALATSALSEPEALQQGGALRVPRLERVTPPSALMQLHLNSRGAISNLQPRQQRARRGGLALWDAEFRVAAVGLNFRDVLNVLGEYPGDPGPPGLDSSGAISHVGSASTALASGDRIFGFAFGCLATTARTDARLLVQLPSCLSLEQAATLPITWSTVHVAFEAARLRSGQRSLLHTTAGGVGLVSLEYAWHIGAAVHATAGGCSKHVVLRRMGQGLIDSSRSGAAFAYGASRRMHAERLKMALNSLSGDLTTASVALQGEATNFVEIGKRGVWSQQRVRCCEAALSLSVLAIDDDLSNEPAWMQCHLTTLSKRAFSGCAHALPLAIFHAWSSYESAFRLLQSGGNIGKVVLRIPLSDQGLCNIFADSTQLITGGTGGLGIITARWLAKHGCSSVILASRSGALGPRAADIATAHVERCDTAEMPDCSRLLALTRASRLPRFRGIWHAAGVLADALLESQTAQAMRRVFAPKLHGVSVLLRATAACQLQSCVLFSSIAALYFGKAQANYAAANGSLDGLSMHRTSRGLHAVSIQWGPWAEVGMAADGDAVSGRLKAASGYGLISKAAQGLAWPLQTALRPSMHQRL